MENNDLNNKILKNVRNKIVVSNLEMEEKMKISKRKQIISIVAVATIFLSGSFLTVNAATDGKLVENIKENLKVVFIKKDGTEEEIKGDVYTDSNGKEYLFYKTNTENSEFQMKVDKNEAENLKVEIEESTDESDI